MSKLDITFWLIVLVVVGLAIFAMSGCAITHVKTDKIEGYAFACFGAEQSGLDVTKDGDDWLFELDSQTSEAEAMMELIKLGVEIGRAGK